MLQNAQAHPPATRVTLRQLPGLPFPYLHPGGAGDRGGVIERVLITGDSPPAPCPARSPAAARFALTAASPPDANRQTDASPSPPLKAPIPPLLG